MNGFSQSSVTITGIDIAKTLTFTVEPGNYVYNIIFCVNL